MAKSLYLHTSDIFCMYTVVAKWRLQLCACAAFFVNSADFEVMCMFKALHKDTTYIGQHKPISREEFFSFYEVQDMRWKEVSQQ